jgi:CheY-like chemotaxis protein
VAPSAKYLRGYGRTSEFGDSYARAAASIKVALAEQNLICDTTDLGDDGLEIGKLHDYDIVLLDLTRAEIQGHEVLRRLHTARLQSPILIVSDLASFRGVRVIHRQREKEAQAEKHTKDRGQSAVTPGPVAAGTGGTPDCRSDDATVVACHEDWWLGCQAAACAKPIGPRPNRPNRSRSVTADDMASGSRDDPRPYPRVRSRLYGLLNADLS